MRKSVHPQPAAAGSTLRQGARRDPRPALLNRIAALNQQLAARQAEIERLTAELAQQRWIDTANVAGWRNTAMHLEEKIAELQNSGPEPLVCTLCSEEGTPENRVRPGSFGAYHESCLHSSLLYDEKLSRYRE